MSNLSHFNTDGHAKMTDVSEKASTLREAIATGNVFVNSDTFKIITQGTSKKGDVLAVAQVAGIMAVKRTPDLIPMCHPISITGVDISFTPDEIQSNIKITATVRSKGETGVEMEALTAVSVTALTIYDMCKSVQKDIEISNIRLLKKSGGKSGDYVIPAKVSAVCISEQKGTIKIPVPEIRVTANYGIEGDAHAGEGIRQVSLLAEESADKLRSKIPNLKPGAFAENILTNGICLHELPIGTKLSIGEALLEITQIGKECHNTGCTIKTQTGECVMPKEGIFATILKSGIIKPNDFVRVESGKWKVES